jgi:uncharacterized protein YjdB
MREHARELFKLILLALGLTSCWSNFLCSDTYSEGTLTLAANTWESDAKNGIEIPVGETLEIRIQNASSGFYGNSCTAESSNPSIQVLASFGYGSDLVRIKGWAVGQAKITVTCTGDSSGEYALCGSRFKDTGSITITVTEPRTTTRANRLFSDSSLIPTSF